MVWGTLVMNCDVGHISRPLGYRWESGVLRALFCAVLCLCVACKDRRALVWRACVWRVARVCCLVSARVWTVLVGRVVHLRAVLVGCTVLL